MVSLVPDDISAVNGKPDLGLLMYGLNDQACFVPLEALLEHYRFVTDRLATHDADTIFLQPTPHIEITQTESERKPESEDPWFAIRTIGFADAIRSLASELQVPLAESFSALWGHGGNTIESSVRSMWPLYPAHYSQKYSSMFETKGVGDTIHPNALGHYAIARASLSSLRTTQKKENLKYSATTHWSTKGVITDLTVSNDSDHTLSGRLEIYPQLKGELQVKRPVPYHLTSGENIKININWPQAKAPEDLLHFPNDIYLANREPIISLIHFSDGGSSVHAIPAPFTNPAHIIRERSVCSQPIATIQLETANGIESSERWQI